MLKTPVAISLVCCEQVIIEEGTKNITLVNCFSRREVDSFPAEPFPFVVFAMLTDGQGEMPLQIRIDRLDTLEEIFTHKKTISLASSLQEKVFGFRIRSCIFPVEGHYEDSLLVNNEPIASRKIRVTQRRYPNE